MARDNAEVKRRARLALVVFFLAWVSCSPSKASAPAHVRERWSEQDPNSGEYWHQDDVRLRSGRIVTCLTVEGTAEQSVSCDWSPQ